MTRRRATRRPARRLSGLAAAAPHPAVRLAGLAAAARRPAVLAAAIASGLLACVLAAGPALAGGPPPAAGSGPGGSGGQAGCSGQSCYASLWQYIRLSGTPGAYTTGGVSGGQAYLPMPPPPCYMEPFFSGPQFYQLWKQGSGQLVGPNGANPELVYQRWAGQIRQYRTSTAGYWWTSVINLRVPGGCGLPLIAWVPNGAAPPLPRVPAIDLATYAYNHMTLPAPVLTVNPVTRSYVSLPTYVWAAVRGGTTQQVTATLGAQSATVVARAGQLYLTAGPAGTGTAYSPCPATGSRSPVGQPPRNSGPGTTPDCGVVFSAPSPAATISAKLSWGITSNYGGFPPIPVAATRTVSVAEIQGLNS